MDESVEKEIFSLETTFDCYRHISYLYDEDDMDDDDYLDCRDDDTYIVRNQKLRFSFEKTDDSKVYILHVHDIISNRDTTTKLETLSSVDCTGREYHPVIVCAEVEGYINRYMDSTFTMFTTKIEGTNNYEIIISFDGYMDDESCLAFKGTITEDVHCKLVDFLKNVNKERLSSYYHVDSTYGSIKICEEDEDNEVLDHLCNCDEFRLGLMCRF